MQKYWRMRNDVYRLSLKETDDCAVMSLALATGISYQEAHEALKIEGRKNCQGTYAFQIEKAAQRFGFKLVMLPKEHRYYKAKTIRSLQKKILAGSFIVASTRHFSAIVDCEVEDWANNTCKRIQIIYKIEKDPNRL